MKTLVIQCYRSVGVPPWIARCLASVESWARLRGHDYVLRGDDAFELCGSDYRAQVRGDLRALANLARLELVAQAHAAGYDLAVWIDADVLVFDPEAFSIAHVRRYAFARETWIERWTPTHSSAFSEVNNSVFVCRRGEPDLAFLIAVTRHVALHRPLRDNYQVGGDLIKGLRKSLDFETLDDVGMFSHFIVRAIAQGEELLVKGQGMLHGTPVHAANLCASENYRPTVTAEEAAATIDTLLATKGSVVNRWIGQGTALTPGQRVWLAEPAPQTSAPPSA